MPLELSLRGSGKNRMLRWKLATLVGFLLLAESKAGLKGRQRRERSSASAQSDLNFYDTQGPFNIPANPPPPNPSSRDIIGKNTQKVTGNGRYILQQRFREVRELGKNSATPGTEDTKLENECFDDACCATYATPLLNNDGFMLCQFNESHAGDATSVQRTRFCNPVQGIDCTEAYDVSEEDVLWCLENGATKCVRTSQLCGAHKNEDGTPSEDEAKCEKCPALDNSLCPSAIMQAAQPQAASSGAPCAPAMLGTGRPALCGSKAIQVHP